MKRIGIILPQLLVTVAGFFYIHSAGKSPCLQPRSKEVTLALGLLFAIVAELVTQGCARSREDAHTQQLAARVKTEFLHAWRNYERYAWGHDALRPLSKTPHDWYGQSLLMTPVDTLDTLVLMKLDAEAAKAKALIVNELSLDRDIYVKNSFMTS
jgi:hypothetical protein